MVKWEVVGVDFEIRLLTRLMFL